MKILAIESSGVSGSVAVCDDEKVIASSFINIGSKHSETLLPLTESLLLTSGVSVNDIDLFAVSCGPGSFTGIRIGVSLIKGLAFGKNKPCVGVSTLEALAYNLRNVCGIICPVMDARRDQYYNALFRVQNGCVTRLCEDRLILCTELINQLSEFNEPVYFVGDGYDTLMSMMKDADCRFVPEHLRYLLASSVASLGFKLYNNGDYTTDAELLPVYLRPTQAERELNEKNSI